MASAVKIPEDRLRPSPLKPGDTVAVVSPAGPPDPGRLDGGVKVLETLGFRVSLGKHVAERRGYLAGSDEARAEDLNQAFRDPDIRGIICSRGGYGATRILPLLDYEAVRNDPKVFVGFSDITALHLALSRRAGLVTFHGPVLGALGHKLTRLTLDCFVRAVTSTEPLDVLPMPEDYPVPRVLRAGRATGLLAGGNLSLISALLGTPYELDAKGRVLLLEDVGEEPYRVDRLLSQLALAGKLGQAAGVALGEMVDCEAPETAPTGARPASPALTDGDVAEAPLQPRSLTLDEVLADHLTGLDKPVLAGLACGHGRDKWTLPLGVLVTVDAYKARFIVEEAGCAG